MYMYVKPQKNIGNVHWPIKPLLKKTGLDLVFKTYWPVSNLQYKSKLTERAVFNELHEHDGKWHLSLVPLCT